MRFLPRLLLGLSLLAPLSTALAQAPAAAQAQEDRDWFYRGSDIAPDPAWRFGTLANGLRYAVRRNALPAGQVSIRVRIAAGSLNEEDHERGWAHLVEHMVFRGTKDFPDREARHLWQKLGASFGSDTNATTSLTDTVYKLDLPDADSADLDASLEAIAQMMDSALLEPAAVDAERRIVLQEKGRMPELGLEMIETSWPLFYAGLKMADRLPIGTEATIGGATAEGLRAFYERWYRPDHATVVIAGDADPAMLEALIAEHFGDWQPTGTAPQAPDYGSIAEVEARTVSLAYPGAPYSASAMWLRPYEDRPNTKAQEKVDLARSLAERIINRRLEAKARGAASFVSARLNESRQPHVADATQLTIAPRDDKWEEALAESFAIISDALASPPSESEIKRELSNLKTAATSAVEGEPTIRSQQRSDQLVSAVDNGTIVSTAPAALSLIEELSPQMTPALVGEAMRSLFEGEGPRMVLLAPVPTTPAELETALAAAEAAAPAERAAERTITFDDLPDPGPEGREVSREQIEDMDVTIVRFANGSSLTFKRTDFEKGSVQVALHFGHGHSGFPADRPSLQMLAGIIAPSGLADLDLDALERLLTGRKIQLGFGVTENSFAYQGATNGTDLADQLRLLAAKIAHPRWDEQVFQRAKTAFLQNYELYYSSASARAGRETAGFTHPGDIRFAPIEKDFLEKLNLSDLQAYYDDLLASGSIDAIIVGDVDLETAVAAMRTSIAALPTRAAAPPQPDVEAVRPPVPDPSSTIFTHKGDPNQAYALIGWTTFGGLDRMDEQRALNVAANIFEVRLFEQFREEEGASYAPNGGAGSSAEFPNWGMFYASSELRPDSVGAFLRAAREIVADLAAKPVAADEFERAINPVKSGIERRIRTNGYWLNALEGWTEDPRIIDIVRDYRSGYASLTAEDIRAAIAAHVVDAGDWSMVVLPDKAQDGEQ